MRGIQSIKAVARADGGFPTYVPHGPSEACMTAACADALSIQGRQNAKLISQALTFLTTQQDTDGSFPVAWSISPLHGIFRILLAVRRNAAIADWRALYMADRAISYVFGAQNDDGGWGLEPGQPSAIVSTAYGLICACYQEDPAPARRAAAYLLDTYRDGAGVISLPDTVGPRPFVFAVPVLTDIFSLLAVGHLMQRLGSTGAEAFPESQAPYRCREVNCWQANRIPKPSQWRLR
jgi:squalene-hopene/tetraprenyl-beta-curcumene cyclase